MFETIVVREKGKLHRLYGKYVKPDPPVQSDPLELFRSLVEPQEEPRPADYTIAKEGPHTPFVSIWDSMPLKGKEKAAPDASPS